MKNVIFIAPPAAGKGTQSDLLVKEFGYEHISTGDLLRAKQNDGSELGNKIKDLMYNVIKLANVVGGKMEFFRQNRKIFIGLILLSFILTFLFPMLMQMFG